jgi:hypothetical protein
MLRKILSHLETESDVVWNMSLKKKERRRKERRGGGGGGGTGFLHMNLPEK